VVVFFRALLWYNNCLGILTLVNFILISECSLWPLMMLCWAWIGLRCSALCKSIGKKSGYQFHFKGFRQFCLLISPKYTLSLCFTLSLFLRLSLILQQWTLCQLLFSSFSWNLRVYFNPLLHYLCLAHVIIRYHWFLERSWCPFGPTITLLHSKMRSRNRFRTCWLRAWFSQAWVPSHLLSCWCAKRMAHSDSVWTCIN
jgi:hypothetical protein